MATLGDLPGYEPTQQIGYVPDEMSTVIRWFELYADTLPPGTAEAARRVFQVPSTTIRVEPTKLVDRVPPPSSGRRPLGILPMFDRAELERRVYTAIARISAVTGATLRHGYNIDLNDNEVLVHASTCGAGQRDSNGRCPPRPAPAYTDRRLGGRCEIRFNPSARKFTDAEFEGALYHEAWHCFQLDRDIQLDRVNVVIPEWIMEGQAQWVAGKLGPEPNGPIAGSYDEWLKKPEQHLFNKMYSALGFFAALDDAGLDPMPRLLGMIGLDSNAAFQWITRNQDPRGLQRWATTLANDPANGTAWQLHQKSVSRFQVTPSVVQVGDGSVQLAPVAPYTADLKRVETTAEVLHIVVSKTSRLSDRGFGGKQDVDVRDDWFCTPLDIDACHCPNDEAKDEPPRPVKSSALLARSGGADSVTGRVEGMTVTEYCNLRSSSTPENACSVNDWLRPGDVQPLARNWNYHPNACSLSFEYVPEAGVSPPRNSRSVMAGLVVQDKLGDFDKPHPPNPVPELGPRAHFPKGLSSYFVKNNISVAGEVLVFPCGRRYCVLRLTEAAAPPDKRGLIRKHILSLAHLIQQRAGGR